MSFRGVLLFFLILTSCTDLFRIPASIDSSLPRCVTLLKKMATSSIFGPAIEHPELYLWDNWGLQVDGQWHLYSLAANKNLSPAKRHHHAHWRHFVSNDQGKTWLDKGAVLQARAGDFFDNQAIWSGSVTALQDGKFLAAYTGLSSERKFLQSISLAISDDLQHFDRLYGQRPLLSHVNQREIFLQKGYYVEHLNKLGSEIGEVNGSIQALRDPFLYQEIEGKLHIFWSAKAFDNHQVVSAIGHAQMPDIYNPDSLEILRPIILPDGDEFTQLELPNVLRLADGKYAWIVSTTKRLSEEQAIDQVMPRVRMYFSDELTSTLYSYRKGDSIILNTDQCGLYGANIIQNLDEILLRTFHIDGASKELTIPASMKLEIQAQGVSLNYSAIK